MIKSLVIGAAATAAALSLLGRSRRSGAAADRGTAGTTTLDTSSDRGDAGMGSSLAGSSGGLASGASGGMGETLGDGPPGAMSTGQATELFPQRAPGGLAGSTTADDPDRVAPGLPDFSRGG